MNAYGYCYACGSAYQRFEDPHGATLLMPTCECAGDPPVDHSGDDWLIHLGNVHRLHYSPQVTLT